MTDQGTIWLTQEAYDKLKAELDDLKGPKRQEIIERISAARDEGDLKENGGYHAAKDEQGKQEGRIRQLTDLLRKAQVGEPPATATNAALGTVITIKFAGDDDTEKFLLGSREIAGTTDLSVYSPESALGSAIMGAKPGAKVTYQAPNGRDITVEVVGIATDHCVRATALDAVRAGFATTVRLDLTAGVLPRTTARAQEEMAGAGVALTGTPR